MDHNLANRKGPQAGTSGSLVRHSTQNTTDPFGQHPVIPPSMSVTAQLNISFDNNSFSTEVRSTTAVSKPAKNSANHFGTNTFNQTQAPCLFTTSKVAIKNTLAAPPLGQTSAFGCRTRAAISQPQQNTLDFGAAQPAASQNSLSGQSTTSKPSGSRFEQTAPQPTTSMFRQAQPTSTTGFGSFRQANQPTNPFAFLSAFGQPTASADNAKGTVSVKYQPTIGTDTLMKGGTPKNVNTKQHCITAMKEYEAKSLEELRMEDYLANRKGPQARTSSGFDTQKAASNTGNLVGSSTQKATGPFGQYTAPASVRTKINCPNAALTDNKPAFGSVASTANTGSSGFGSNVNTTATGGELFSQKPPPAFGANSAFGTTAPNTGFSNFQGNTGGSLFNNGIIQPPTTVFSSFGSQTSPSPFIFNANKPETTSLRATPHKNAVRIHQRIPSNVTAPHGDDKTNALGATNLVAQKAIRESSGTGLRTSANSSFNSIEPSALTKKSFEGFEKLDGHVKTSNLKPNTTIGTGGTLSQSDNKSTNVAEGVNRSEVAATKVIQHDESFPGGEIPQVNKPPSNKDGETSHWESWLQSNNLEKVRQENNTLSELVPPKSAELPLNTSKEAGTVTPKESLSGSLTSIRSCIENRNDESSYISIDPHPTGIVLRRIGNQIEMELRGRIPVDKFRIQEGKIHCKSPVREPDYNEQDSKTDFFTLLEDNIALRKDNKTLKTQVDDYKTTQNELLEENSKLKDELDNLRRSQIELESQIKEMAFKLAKTTTEKSALNELDKMKVEAIDCSTTQLQSLQEKKNGDDLSPTLEDSTEKKIPSLANNEIENLNIEEPKAREILCKEMEETSIKLKQRNEDHLDVQTPVATHHP